MMIPSPVTVLLHDLVTVDCTQRAGVSTVTECATRPPSARILDAPLHLRNVSRRREKGAVCGPHYKNTPAGFWECANGDTEAADGSEHRPPAPARG